MKRILKIIAKPFVWYWKDLNPKGKLFVLSIIAAVLGVLALVGCIGYLRHETTVEREARGQEGQRRVDEAKTEDNQAAENVNVIKNQNYNALSNDELRNRLINAARKSK
jgi:hypothetical protein